jgi:hypothetical protein
LVNIYAAGGPGDATAAACWAAALGAGAAVVPGDPSKTVTRATAPTTAASPTGLVRMCFRIACTFVLFMRSLWR